MYTNSRLVHFPDFQYIYIVYLERYLIRRIKAIWDFVTCHRCCRPDVPGMIIQDRMLMMAGQSSGYDSSQTPSLQLRHVFERANVGFPSYQDAWKLLIAQFVENQLCKLG